MIMAAGMRKMAGQAVFTSRRVSVRSLGRPYDLAVTLPAKCRAVLLQKGREFAEMGVVAIETARASLPRLERPVP